MVGNKYSMADAKMILNQIRQSLGMSGISKATDLGNYFIISKTKIPGSDGKFIHGIKIKSVL